MVPSSNYRTTPTSPVTAMEIASVAQSITTKAIIAKAFWPSMERPSGFGENKTIANTVIGRANLTSNLNDNPSNLICRSLCYGAWSSAAF